MHVVGSRKPWDMLAPLFVGGIEDYADSALGLSRGDGRSGPGTQNHKGQSWNREGARRIIEVLRAHHPEMVAESRLRVEAELSSKELTRLLNLLSIRCTLYEESPFRRGRNKNYFGLLDPDQPVRDIEDDGN